MDHAALDGELDRSIARFNSDLGIAGFQCAGHGCLLDFHLIPSCDHSRSAAIFQAAAWSAVVIPMYIPLPDLPFFFLCRIHKITFVSCLSSITFNGFTISLVFFLIQYISVYKEYRRILMGRYVSFSVR